MATSPTGEHVPYLCHLPYRLRMSPPPTLPTLAFSGTSQLLSMEQLGVLFSFTSPGPIQCDHPVVEAQSVSCESGGKRGLFTVLTEFLLCI